jgi:cell division protein FtsQ
MTAALRRRLATVRRVAGRVRLPASTRARRLLACGVLAALVGVAAWILFASSLLGVRRVVVVGTHRLSAAAILAAAAVPRHHPLATLDTGAVARRVDALAAVGGVEVVRDWPGTVRLVVRERTPVAVERGNGRYVLVDGSGVAFWPVSARPARLPLLDVATGRDRAAATRAGLSVLAALPGRLRAQVTAVRAPTPAAVALLLRRHKTVVWGTPGDARRKIAVLAALLRRHGHVYDVSTPTVATIR